MNSVPVAGDGEVVVRHGQGAGARPAVVLVPLRGVAVVSLRTFSALWSSGIVLAVLLLNHDLTKICGYAGLVL